MNQVLHLNSSRLETPLGDMIAVADAEKLYLLEFLERQKLALEMARLKKKLNAVIVPGDSFALQSIQHELRQYFSGTLKQFKTSLFILGSDFQKSVWKALIKIPHGDTCSYAELASFIDRPSACRAVANANASNQIAIVIPCHRVINTNGQLGGYAAGLMRKRWLLSHEAATPD